jgi:hypothetical protein
VCPCAPQWNLVSHQVDENDTSGITRGLQLAGRALVVVLYHHLLPL